VTGIEHGITKNISVAAYYSRSWAKSAFYLQPNGVYVGYGFPLYASVPALIGNGQY
jgi:hypothetical protein